MKFLRDERAVSPVIGVILMVAVTITLAAIVASFVMGTASGVDKPRIVETRVIQRNETHGELTLIKGPESATIRYLNVTITNSLGATSTVSQANPSVGTVISIPDVTPGNDHIIVVARFEDGKEQVVLDGYI